MPQLETTYYLFAALAAALGVIAFLLRARRADKDSIKREAKAELWADVQRSFIGDVASNHLPHIQHCLQLIADALKIDIPEPPPIRYIALDTKELIER